MSNCHTCGNYFVAEWSGAYYAGVRRNYWGFDFMQTILLSLVAGLVIGIGYGHLFRKRLIRAFKPLANPPATHRWSRPLVASFFTNYVLILAVLVLLMRSVALNLALTLVAILVGFGCQVFRLRSLE